MTITTYTYDENYGAEVMAENVSINDAITKLKNSEINFFKVEDETGIFEITLSSTDELITNGFELF